MRYSLPIEEQDAVLLSLKRARVYVQQAHDNAESKHDSYGRYYMCGAMYEIMEDTKELLVLIDKQLGELE
jgi:hypothetical protein